MNIGSVPDNEWFLLHLSIDAEAKVEVFNDSGEKVYFPGNSFSLRWLEAPYDGRVLAEPELAKVQINTKGTWTLETQPVSAAIELDTPATVEGMSDEVIRLVGNPSSLSVSGNYEDASTWFSVMYFQTSNSRRNIIVNEPEEYVGVAVVAGDRLLAVGARSKWSIASKQ